MEFEIPVPVGIALIVGSVLWTLWKADEARRLRSRFRVRPWLYRADWREGIVYDKSRTAAWWDAVAAGGFFFLGLGSILWKDLYEREGWIPITMILAFGGIPFGRRVYKALHRRAGSAASFRFGSVPFRVGDTLRGTVHVRVPSLAPVTFAELSLSVCQVDGDGDLVRSSEINRIVYPSKCTQRGTQMRIPIELEIRSGTPPSEPFRVDPLYWELQVRLPDLNYQTEFVVPVFACGRGMVGATRYGRSRGRCIVMMAPEHHIDR